MKNTRMDNDTDDDDDGGIETGKKPDLDLPPGICLPPDPGRPVQLEKELIG